jgi:hypothetical protein
MQVFSPVLRFCRKVVKTLNQTEFSVEVVNCPALWQQRRRDRWPGHRPNQLTRDLLVCGRMEEGKPMSNPLIVYQRPL